MAREDFLKELDARNFKAKEIIDGVTVVHTGRYENVSRRYESEYFCRDEESEEPEDLWYPKQEVLQEVLEIYDSNGNRFYSNCSSIEEAEKLVEKLKQEGKNAVIGPKAPWKGDDGQLIKNRSENDVGVYIVKEKEEQTKETVLEK